MLTFKQVRHDPASGRIEISPPAVIVITEVKNICGARLDRQGLGNADVVDVGGRHLGEARPHAVGIIDNVQLGPTHAGRELCPIGAQRTQPKAGGIDEIHRVREATPQPAFAAAHEFGQKPREHRARPLCIGIGKRRARNLAGAEMIKLAGVALEICLDRPQALAARQLRVQQGDKLVLRRQPAHPLVSRQLVHQAIQHMPRHELQHGVKYCIVVAHGVGSFPCLERRQNVKTQKNPCHALRPQKLNRTAVV